MNRLKIAFSGKMGAGKNEACSYLKAKHTGKILSFADPLYEIQKYAQEKCGFKFEKDRKFLQFIGTEWAREKDPDVWVRITIKASERYARNHFVSDLRFPNEFSALKKEGWICVKIIRSHQEDRKGTGSHTHSSENALDFLLDKQWDYIIDNNEGLENFHDQLDKIIDNIDKLK